MSARDILDKLHAADEDITKWVKNLDIIQLDQWRRVKEKRAGIVANINAMGYQVK